MSVQAMTLWGYVIWGIGTFLQGLILARGFYSGTYRRYGFFYAAMSYSLLESFFIIYVFIQKPAFAWEALLWLYCISPFFGFLIAWEIYRQIFAGFSQLQLRVGKVVSLILIFLVGLSFAANFAARPLQSFPVLAIEWQCRLAQGTLLAFSLLLAKYHMLPLGRNVRGMAFGFGLFVFLAIANFALRGQFGDSHRYVGYIYSLSTLATYGIWSRSLWHYAPNPAVSPMGATAVSRGALSVAWAKTFEALKKGFGR